MSKSLHTSIGDLITWIEYRRFSVHLTGLSFDQKKGKGLYKKQMQSPWPGFIKSLALGLLKS